MPRRSSFITIMNQVAKDSEKARRQTEQARIRQQRQQERLAKESARLRTIADKQARQEYLANRAEEVEESNAELNREMEALSGILKHSLSVDNKIYFDTLRIHDKFVPSQIPIILTNPVYSIPFKQTFLSQVKEPNALSKLVPGAKEKHQKALNEASILYEKALAEFQSKEEARKAELERIGDENKKAEEAFQLNGKQRDKEVAELEEAYRTGDPDAIVSYSTMVLERSSYPEGFPQEFRIAYLPEPKELVIEYELPEVAIIPTIEEYRYIKTKDTIDEKSRKASEIKELYQDIVASVCLRTINEVFEADQCNTLAIVTFNGFVQTVEPATGRDIRPCLISVRAT
jgi:restriction system protein